MENTINERISLLITKLKMNVNTFSKSLNRSYSSLDSIIKGKTKPGYDLLETIINSYSDVNPMWLLTGNGEMFVNNQKQSSIVSESDSYLKEHLRNLEENFARLAAQLEAKDKQLEAAGRTVEGLQRTVDALLVNMPGKLVDTPLESRIVPLWPVEEKAAV